MKWAQVFDGVKSEDQTAATADEDSEGADDDYGAAVSEMYEEQDQTTATVM